MRHGDSHDAVAVDVVVVDAVAALRGAADVLAQIDPSALSGAGLGQVLLDLMQVRRQVDGALATLGDRFAHGDEWGGDGARDAVAWLRGHTADGFGPARQIVATGQACAQFEIMAGALRHGLISIRHMQVLTEVAEMFPRLSEHLRRAQPQILDLAREREPAALRRSLIALCYRLDPSGSNDDSSSPEYYLRASTILDGAVRVDGLLPADVGALLVAALEAARRQRPDPEQSDDAISSGNGTQIDSSESIGDTETDSLGSLAGASGETGERPVDVFGNPIPPPSADPHDSRLTGHRNVEALQRLLALATSTFTTEGNLPSVAGQRPTINVTIPVSTLSTDPEPDAESDPTIEVDGGGCAWLERFGVPHQPLPTRTAQRLACDASLRPLIVDEHGELVVFGSASRIIPPAMRALVVRRDRHCRFAGCRARIDEVHHVIFYSRGGPTRSDNLLGLCWFHHHLVHEGGWLLAGDANASITGSYHGPRQKGGSPQRDGSPQRAWATAPPGASSGGPSG